MEVMPDKGRHRKCLIIEFTEKIIEEYWKVGCRNCP